MDDSVSEVRTERESVIITALIAFESIRRHRMKAAAIPRTCNSSMHTTKRSYHVSKVPTIPQRAVAMKFAIKRLEEKCMSKNLGS